MKAKILIVLVLLFLLFSSLNIFAAACPTAGGCVGKCDLQATSVCTNYYEIYPSAVGKQCGVVGPCSPGTICSPQCTIGAGCTASYRSSAAACTAIGTESVCDARYETGATNKFCYWDAFCKVGGTCVPEFFGFEFREMEISTGIIALLAAIALPMWMFEKRK
tara:strand:- start:2322 stop:2810 length:489 start_codon:yes stop_codon:yes gene_type:complete